MSYKMTTMNNVEYQKDGKILGMPFDFGENESLMHEFNNQKLTNACKRKKS